MVRISPLIRWPNLLCHYSTKEYTVANRHNYPASSKRYQLTDIDGEDAFIRIGSIAMVRVPLDAMEPVEEDDE